MKTISMSSEMIQDIYVGATKMQRVLEEKQEVITASIRKLQDPEMGKALAGGQGEDAVAVIDDIAVSISALSSHIREIRKIVNAKLEAYETDLTKSKGKFDNASQTARKASTLKR